MPEDPPTHTHSHKPTKSSTSVLTSLWQSPLLLPPRNHDRKLLHLSQYYGTGISTHNSWIWSLPMRDFTAVCPHRAQRGAVPQLKYFSLTLSPCIFFFSFSSVQWLWLQKSGYGLWVLIWSFRIETKWQYGRPGSVTHFIMLLMCTWPFKTIGGPQNKHIRCFQFIQPWTNSADFANWGT